MMCSRFRSQFLYFVYSSTWIISVSVCPRSQVPGPRCDFRCFVIAELVKAGKGVGRKFSLMYFFPFQISFEGDTNTFFFIDSFALMSCAQMSIGECHGSIKFQSDFTVCGPCLLQIVTK